MKDFLRSPETVLIPKGDARRASVEAFQMVTDIEVSGSVEGVARLITDERFVVADIVDTGETSRQNGLEEFKKLMDIYPEVVFIDQLSGTIEKGKS